MKASRLNNADQQLAPSLTFDFAKDNNLFGVLICNDNSFNLD